MFVGTGLNLLISGSGHNVVVSIDGGADSANLASAITVQPLAGRNYAQDLVLNLASGLSYGLHTVRVKTTTGSMDVNGIEILNESSSVKTSPGLAIVNGLKRTLASVDSQAYNTGFDSGTLGTRGGRVVMYMRADGTIGKSVQPVAAASAFLTSTSHTDEEVIRSYNWKEFGSGRADDFSVIAGGAAANYTFTLDDGTTTLAGNQVRSNVTSNGALRPESSGSFVSLTFVGTGLDISAWLSASSSDTYQVIVDGTNVGNLNSSFAGTINRTIASGLPYGTHTVKINRVGAASNNLEINSFTVYGPKKPSLPSGAMELADYNIMATYVANATAGSDTIGTGVLRKSSTREHVYSGASWGFTSLNTSLIALLHIQSTTSGGYVEYTFFGTGFEWRSRGFTTFQPSLSLQLQASGGSLSTVSTTNYTISHNGGGASGSGPAITTTTFGGFAFTPASGNLSQAVSNTDGSGFTLTGLALGLYKVRITQGSATLFEHGVFDVITPIHVHKNNGPFVMKNTLSIGSQGVNDSRKFGDLLPTVPNTSVQAFGLASSSTTSTAYVPVVDLSATIKTTGNPIQISYALEGYCNTLNHGISLQIYIDGVAAGTEKFIAQAVASTNVLFSDSIMVAVSPGVHKVDLHWKVSSGTGTLSTGRRNLTVREI